MDITYKDVEPETSLAESLGIPMLPRTGPP
jgi:hypothetical protein